MQWTDEAIVLGAKRHGETSVILELMTQERGRHLGLVRGGTGTRLRGVLQPGNSLRATWRARLDEHLGHYVVEGINLRAAGFLAELGFGLDLASCAATGATADLIYVSPRTGRAVSREAGEAYREKLMRLPG